MHSFVIGYNTKPLNLNNKTIIFTGFTILPTNITARLSFPARFDCQSSTGFIRWGVGPQTEILSNVTCPGCYQLLNGSLYIPSVKQSHSGMYTCFIFGGSEDSFYNVYLTVTG